jgi:ABC-type lipoprotein release transport system permease subunit
MMLLRMAWRNLWRNPRRTVVTTGAMTLALWVMVLYSGLIEGYWRGMERSIRELEVGDVQLFAKGYLESPSLFTAIEDTRSVLHKLDEAGIAASARLRTGGLAAVGDQSAGISLVGLDVARDAKVCGIGKAVATGSWLDPQDPQGVVIGRRLSRALGAKPGTDLVVVTQGADGSLANDLFRVRGVLEPVSDGTDRTGVLMNEATFRSLLVIPQGAHQFIVRRPASADLDATAARIRGLLPELDTRTWRQLMPTVASMLDSTRSVVFIVFFTVYLAVAILVLNAMLMAVFERIRELGVLKSLGFSPVGVLGLILIESGIQTGLALAAGLTASIPGILYLSKIGIDVGRLGGTAVLGHAMPTVWHGEYTWQSLSGPVIMLCVMVSAGALYPSLKAAWIRPVAAVRHL